MKVDIKRLVCIPLIATLLLSYLLRANSEVISTKCQEVYKTCSQQNIASAWMSYFACDEVAEACMADRKPNTKRYLDGFLSLPKTEWELAAPKEERLRSTSMQKALVNASSIPQLRSFLVATNGKLVVEEYFDRKNDPRAQHIQSVTKSITSLLIGIAIDKGFITSEKEVIKPYFPEYFSKPHDERKEKITIQQLLTMSSRLNFVDNAKWSTYKNTRSWSELGAYSAYWASDNYLDLALEDDFVESNDHQVVLYSTPACNLLTTILRRSTNMTTKEFADKYLFEPLGIFNYFWGHDSSYNYIGGHTVFLRPRALARIGQMIMDGGRFGGRQIVSQEWLNRSFSTSVPRFVNMKSVPQVIDYGYLWYVGEYKRYKYQFAWGFGGQFLFLIPEANTLVVTTAFPDPDGLTHWRRSQQIIKNIMLNVIKSLPDKI